MFNGQTQSPECTYGVRGSVKKIVLFGDSHAAQWFPALEKIALARGYELISLSKSACPGPAVKKVEPGAYKNADCSAWRSNAIARIQKIQPDAVLVSGMQNYEIPKGYSDRATWWKEGEVKTFSALKGSSRHIIFISDTPHPNRDIPSCIAAGKLNRCNGSERAVQIFTAGYQQINPTPWLCTRNCPAIISGTVVYRDASHISVAMAQQLSNAMDRSLINIGVFPPPN